MGLMNWQEFWDMSVKDLIKNREEAERDIIMINWIIRKKNLEEDITNEEMKMLGDYENGRIKELNYEEMK